MRTAVVESDSRSGNEILYRGGNEQLSWPCGRSDPSPYMNGNAADSPLKHLALACVNPGSDRDAQLANILDDLAGARQSLRWTLKGSQETVPRSVDLTSTKAVEFLAHDRVMIGKKFAPSMVT